MPLEVKSCGVILFRRDTETEFLLLRKPGGFDFPKGHVERGETELECAFRELREETGVPAELVELDADFRFSLQYPVFDKYLRAPAIKTLVLFLGRLRAPVDLVMTEHDDFEWRVWRPRERIQRRTIDPAFAAVRQHWERRMEAPPIVNG